jgi:pimeloyl-ACP methyl ester carboxylesterase
MYNVYALLVGIDAYPSPIAPLRGCVNDVEAFEQYLQGWVQNTPGYQLQTPCRLHNQQATRQAIMDGFRIYLSQAQAGDIALFYYSGHGSQAPSPPEFWMVEPDRFDETLVCWDSRLDGQWDLADKELASLIAEVAQSNPHIVIILDCCHSGAGTRNALQTTATRRVPPDTRVRPFETFRVSPATLDITTSRSATKNQTGWTFPVGRHILLAACREHEEAREFYGDGQHRGAFSYFLLETLQQSNGALSYHDLFKRTSARVRSQVLSQSPQLEATDSTDLNQPFLAGAIAPPRSYYTVSYSPTQGWIIDGGAVHGIPKPTSEEYPQLALFPFDASSEPIRDLQRAIAKAEITHVLPHISKLRITQSSEHLAVTRSATGGLATTINHPDLDINIVFKAVLVTVPVPPTTVSLEGDSEGISLVRRALNTASLNGQASLYLRESNEHTLAQIRLLAQHGEYWIIRPADSSPLVKPLQGYTLEQAITAVRQLEHIARWMMVADLSSPAVSQIPADALQIQIYLADSQEPLMKPQIDLSYQWNADQQKWQQPTFRVKLVNQSNLTLFCALYDLTETFGITSVLEGGTVRLEPKEEVWVAQGKPIYGTVPTKLWQQGITELQDILKAVACTAEFDARLLEQQEVGHPQTRSPQTHTPQRGTLNRLMQRIITRHLGTAPEDEEISYDDWVTNQIIFTLIRPQLAPPICPTQAINLGLGALLAAHPTLQGTARLTTLSQATRDSTGVVLPPLLRTDPTVSQPLQFGDRSLEAGLSVLELKVSNPDVITPTHPLTLTLPVSLRSNEYVLPIAHDGEFFLPLGRGHAAANQTEIILERLPNPTGDGSRSLGGSIRIFFQKVVAQKLGLEFPYPILAAVSWTAEGTPHYEVNRTSISQQVAKSSKILLLIHGILGDTQSMAAGIHQAEISQEGQRRSLTDCYDLILTFDYENLNTPIDEIAKQLSDRLTAVGLSANHGKTLHVVAHSLGGLVARYWIERQGGNQVVQHLIMQGTPNAGSPWSTLQDWAIIALTIGLNSLSSVAFPLKALGNLLAAIELVDITLDQIKPGSDFLKSLYDSPDPGIPYTVMAGNISLVALPDQTTQNRVIQLLKRVSQTAIEFPFMSQPNDLFATVYSIQHLPPDRSPAPNLVEVACNHLGYLTDANGLESLSNAMMNTDRLAATVSSITDVVPEEQVLPKVQPNEIKTSEISKPKNFRLFGLLILLVLSAIAGILLYQKYSEQQNSDPSASFLIDDL